MKQLTPRQSEVLELIKECMQETGMPPTRAEIALRLGFKSANAAEEHLKALARRRHQHHARHLAGHTAGAPGGR